MQLGVAVLGGVLLRLLLLAFRYTDIDYLVFTDATRFVALGRSPYDRATYRYTPLLAWLLYPTIWPAWFEFGKILFAVADLVAGWLIYRILRLRGMESSRAVNYASIWWLNPIVAGISTRGSSEGLLAIIIVAILWSVQTRRPAVAGCLLGLAVHFKIYPFIYAASIFWAMGDREPFTISTLASLPRINLAVFSFITFMALNIVMYRSYGMPFIEHSYTYHLTRIDHRHNFSIYNTLLHLNSAYNNTGELKAESLAFIPQMLLSVVALPLLLAKKDLAGTMLAQTFAFVTFNKVCTSQYFLWYMVFLPFYLPSSSLLKRGRLGITAATLWVLGQALWLQQGYELEFNGRSTFAAGLWASSAVFFLINCWILGIIALRPSPPPGPTAEQIASGHNILPDLREVDRDPSRFRPGVKFIDSNANFTSPYPVGSTKPIGQNYTKTLVIASTKEENTTWVEPELGDLIEAGLLKTAVYVVNDKWAPLKAKNKGHEASVYLTYIIDNYDKLSDVTIFMHAHQFTWHNNELHDGDAALMVRDLSPQRVSRLGYMNMRCHFEPGCPDWLHPGETTRDLEKQEQHIIADQWAELFPGEPVPSVLSQACCAQFAVSRDRILSLPKARYMALRKWLYKTKLDDYISGRIFEYTWQYIFTKSPIDCPAMSACYCDGYGLCMEDTAQYQDWVDLRYHLGEMKTELLDWWEKSDLAEAFRKASRDGRSTTPDHLKVEPGRDVVLERNITETWSKMRQMRRAAYELGKDPAQRALQAGRSWSEGDDY